MRLRELIKHLQAQQAEFGGDVPIFVSGEFGINNPKRARKHHFIPAKAIIEYGLDEQEDYPDGINDDTIIMQIGDC
jgi:hypothetical protein